MPDSAEFSVEADYGDFDDIRTTLPLSVLTDLLAFVMRTEGVDKKVEIGIALVDESEIIDLHQRFLGDASRTDILTFPEAPESASGEIAICVPVAQENATELGTSAAWEVAFLVVHGVLHLLGWHDESEQEQAAMLVRQETLLDQWGRVSR